MGGSLQKIEISAHRGTCVTHLQLQVVQKEKERDCLGEGEGK